MEPDNYRPASLTCVSSKIMESVVRDYVDEEMMKSGFLSVFQHGFTKGKSCATNLLTAFETWTKWMDEGLMLANVDPTVIKWIAAFFAGKKNESQSQTGIFRLGLSIEWRATGICVGSSSVFGIHK